MIKLRFLSERDPGAVIIKYWTWSIINHVEFVLPDGYLGARIIGGVKVRPFNYIKGVREYFAHIDVDPATEKKIIDWARLQVGKSYDITAILGMGFKRDWDAPDSWFCSELVSAGFKQAGVPLFNETIPLDRITPRDIAILQEVKFD